MARNLLLISNSKSHGRGYLDHAEEEIRDIVKKAEFQKTYDKLLKFATLRPRSGKEINDWLRRKRVHESLYKDLFNRLRKLELADDQKFAKWWVEQRNAFSPRAKRFLNYELRNKGIKREVIEEVLNNIKLDEEKIAIELLKKKAYRWKALPKRESRQKISQFLARKGFNWETIKEIIK